LAPNQLPKILWQERKWHVKFPSSFQKEDNSRIKMHNKTFHLPTNCKRKWFFEIKRPRSSKRFFLLHIIFFKRFVALKKLISRKQTNYVFLVGCLTRRKTFFNYFSIVIYNWKHHFQLQNVFCNSKMMLSTNFQNSQQCSINPTTQLKTMYTCQFVG